MQELLQHDVQVEAFGGDTLAVEVSATKSTNLDKLLEAIALQAELLDLVADPDRGAEGTVIEARLDRGRGPVATVLVQRGTLKVGALVVAGSHWGRVRALIDDKGATSRRLRRRRRSRCSDSPARRTRAIASPWSSPKRAREKSPNIASARGARSWPRAEPASRTSLADMMSNLKAAGHKEMPIVLKGDVQGSVEAITSAVEKLGNDEVMARVIHGGAGGMTESDVTLATASKAVILGFNVRANKEARDLAEQAGVEIRYYNIIYNLVDDVKAALSGMLAPTLRETMLGNAQILELFDISKVGMVAGCRVTDGVVQRGAHVRLIRDSVVVHEGKLSTLKRFKDEVAGAGRAGMRHGVRELPGHAGRRRHRVLHRRGDPPHAVTAARGTIARRPELQCLSPSFVRRRLRFGSTGAEPPCIPPMPQFAPRLARSAQCPVLLQTANARSHRLERVGELIRHAVAEILARGEVRDEALDRHPLTIPAVRMSPDLKLATVLVMPLGGKGAGAAIEALDRHKKELRALVARRVNLKFAPDLRFALDTSFEAQARMDALLRSPAVARDLKSRGEEDKE